MLDMTLRDLERVLYFEAYVVIDPGMTKLEKGQLLSEEAYYDAIEEHGDEFEARMGADAIQELLRAINLEVEVPRIRDELTRTSSEARHKNYPNVLNSWKRFSNQATNQNG